MRVLRKILLGFLVFILILVGYFFVGNPPEAENIIWGVNFSQKHAQLMGLDWQETYSALLDDLEVKNIKLLTHWDLIEPNKDEYNFNALDWQIKAAEQKGAKLLLVVGMKTGRWPECHIPDWAQDLEKDEQQKEVLELVEKIIGRYRDSETIEKWQAENEHFFHFGECPWTDQDFVEKEIEIIRSLDNLNRFVLISDTGEFSSWRRSAKLGDIVGTTMYRKIWLQEMGIYINYPFPPLFYWAKTYLIERFLNKKVIVVELQAEPWGPKLLYDSSLSEQEKTMNPQQFYKNIKFAKKTGFDEFYLWGAEWWYWLKEKQGNSEMWGEAKKLFN